MYERRLAVEAFVVGVGIAVLGSMVARLAMLVRGEERQPDLSLEASLFVTGALFHVLCEVTGINGWYLTNSVATLKAIVPRRPAM